MGPFFPPPLSSGDKVALTAPASPVSPEALSLAVDSLIFLGLEPVIMPSCTSRCEYLSGSDSRRADDINHAFASREIKGIFCIRGGYGSARLLPLLDTAIIQKNPKPFVGYSDITALHCASSIFGPMVTFHGPMPSSGYRLMDDFTLASLKLWLFSPDKAKSLENPPEHRLEIICPGKASGILTGGNLSVLVSTLGSPYEIDTKGKILFIEDVNEEPYKIDRALTSLTLAGKFRDCSAVLLGTFSECEPKNPTCEYSADSIIRHTVSALEKPVVSNIRAGHIPCQLTLPMGALIHIDAVSSAAPKISVL